MSANPLHYGWWLASRSAGIVALLCVTGSVVLGLLMANNLPRRAGAKARLRPMHEAIALAGLVALAVHGLSLLGDPWLRPGISGISIPFSSHYRPLYTGIGVIAGYGIALLGLSFYVRRQIGARRWRQIHRFTVAAYALAIIHVLGAGTDAGQRWLEVVLLASVAPVVILFAMRMLSGPGTGSPPRPRTPPPARRPAARASTPPPARRTLPEYEAPAAGERVRDLF